MQNTSVSCSLSITSLERLSQRLILLEHFNIARAVVSRTGLILRRFEKQTTRKIFQGWEQRMRTRIGFDWLKFQFGSNKSFSNWLTLLARNRLATRCRSLPRANGLEATVFNQTQEAWRELFAFVQLCNRIRSDSALECRLRNRLLLNWIYNFALIHISRAIMLSAPTVNALSIAPTFTYEWVQLSSDVTLNFVQCSGEMSSVMIS